MTPTPTVATPVTTAAPAVATPSAQPTRIAALPPTAGPIVAVLAAPITTYTVEAASPAGLPLTYRWSLIADAGQECGRKDPATPDPITRPSAIWSHDNGPPDNCRHDAPNHPFTITVEISDGVNAPIQRTYRGTNTGRGQLP